MESSPKARKDEQHPQESDQQVSSPPGALVLVVPSGHSEPGLYIGAVDACLRGVKNFCNARALRSSGGLTMIYRMLPIALLAVLPGCFAPEVPAGGTGGSDATDAGSSGGSGGSSGPASETSSSSTGADASTGSGGVDTTEESSGSVGQPPTITLFTANGVESDLAVSVSSGVDLRVEATDADGTVVEAEFFRDGVSVAVIDMETGGGFAAEMLVSGAEENGDSDLEAVVRDNDGNTASATIDASFDLPNGGLIESWNFDNGVSASVYAIRPNAEGDQVVWTGAAEVANGTAVLRADRAEGASWQSTQNDGATFGSDIIIREDGTHLVAGSFDDAGDLTTGLFEYTSAGNTAGQTTINGAPNPGPNNWALGLEQDSDGRVYILGAYAGAGPSSYLARLTDDLTVDWKRDVTGSAMTDGSPVAYDFDVRADGMIAVVGGRAVGSDKLWIGIYDTSGDLQDQLTLSSEFDTSIGYDVSWFEDGGLVVSGTVNEGDGWARIVRAYDDELIEEWTLDGPSNDDFAQAVTTDAFGRTIAVSTETCSLNAAGALFDSCRLVVRSYDREGQLRWQHQAEGSDPEFNGPVLFLPGFKADVEVDRYGYVYVSAQHRLPLGGDERRSEWWAEKHHP